MSLVASSPLVSSTRRPIPMRRRPDLVARRIEYQGIGSWVIKDPVGLKYHRLHAEQYSVLCLLDGTRNLEQIREELLRIHPTLHVTLSDVQRLLTDLHQKGLLQTLRFGQGTALLKHHRKERRQRIWNAARNILYCACPAGIPSGPSRGFTIMSRGFSGLGWSRSASASCWRLWLWS